MATSQRARTRRPTSPANNAVTGVVLVVVAVVVGIYLLAKGGGVAPADANAGRSPAAVANNKPADQTTVPTTPPVTTPIGQLNLVVSNGSGVQGRGNTVATQLKTLGYAKSVAKNGKKAANQVTAVYFVGSAANDAKGVAAALKLAPETVKALPAIDIPLEKPTDLGSAQVLVLVGADFPFAK